MAAVLQAVVPALRRAEQSLAEAEDCRAAFPRITRVRRTEVRRRRFTPGSPQVDRN